MLTIHISDHLKQLFLNQTKKETLLIEARLFCITAHHNNNADVCCHCDWSKCLSSWWICWILNMPQSELQFFPFKLIWS